LGFGDKAAMIAKITAYSIGGQPTDRIILELVVGTAPYLLEPARRGKPNLTLIK